MYTLQIVYKTLEDNIPDVGVTTHFPADGGQDANKTYSADPVADLNVFV